MNLVVEEQLSKVKIANLPPYDETTTHLVIHKKDGVSQNDFIVGGEYLIQIEDYIINPYEGFTLHDNWNNGIPPIYNILKVRVSEIVGKMIKVSSVGFDISNGIELPDRWEGWLPKKGVKILNVM